MGTTRVKLNDGASRAFSSMLGRTVEFADEVSDIVDNAKKVLTNTKAFNSGRSVVRAFADAGMGVTPEDTFMSQNESSNLQEPLPVEDEYRGMTMTGSNESGEKGNESEAEVKPEGQQTEAQEKTEIEGIVAQVKDIVDAEGTDKAIKKQGEEIIAELEAHKMSFVNAKEFISKNLPAQKEGETKEEEKAEEGKPGEEAEGMAEKAKSPDEKEEAGANRQM